MKTKTPTFEEFWNLYPLHKGKRDAERAWNRLSARDKQKALDGIPPYCVYLEQTGVSVKYPQGWLNGHRWEDEYEEPAIMHQRELPRKYITNTPDAGNLDDTDLW